jgi:hypothetical protein
MRDGSIIYPSYPTPSSGVHHREYIVLDIDYYLPWHETVSVLQEVVNSSLSWTCKYKEIMLPEGFTFVAKPMPQTIKAWAVFHPSIRKPPNGVQEGTVLNVALTKTEELLTTTPTANNPPVNSRFTSANIDPSPYELGYLG